MPPLRFNPSPCPRLHNWTHTEQVIDSDTVDVGFDEHHPKEPAAVYHDGVTYVACAVWNRYDQHINKEVVLCTAPSPDGEFTQQCQVTDGHNREGYNHAPGITVEDGELWIVYSRATDGNDVHAKHAPVSNLPDAPSGWTDAGMVLDAARDPGLLRGPDGDFHLVAKDERNKESGDPGVVRVRGPTVTELSGREVIYDNTLGEAPELIPKASGQGYWLVTAEGGASIRPGPRMSVAGESDFLDGDFKGYYCLGTHRTLGGITNPFHEKWALHHDYLHLEGGPELYQESGATFAFFEGGDGAEFSIGVGFLQTPNTS